MDTKMQCILDSWFSGSILGWLSFCRWEVTRLGSAFWGATLWVEERFLSSVKQLVVGFLG